MSILPPLKLSSVSACKPVPESETNINLIVERFKRTGSLPIPVRPGAYADVSEMPDAHKAMSVVRVAQNVVAEKVAKVKKEAKEKKDSPAPSTSAPSPSTAPGVAAVAAPVVPPVTGDLETAPKGGGSNV